MTSFLFVPNGFAKTKAENLAHYLQTEYLMTPVANTRLLGNSDGSKQSWNTFCQEHLLQRRSQIYKSVLI